jgi:single-stranded DNA-binding protein
LPGLVIVVVQLFARSWQEEDEEEEKKKTLDKHLAQPSRERTAPARQNRPTVEHLLLGLVTAVV